MAYQRDKDLDRDFKSLATSRNARERGLEFEKLLVRLFHRDGFSARLNAGTARPRQTDIYAKRFSDEFIVEAKWRSRPIDVDGVDSLRARLGRVRSHFTGLLMSMSGFTEEAISQAQEYRAQEVLLFREDEIVLLFSSGKYDLADLIQKKRQHLRTDGKILFSPESARRWTTETPELPRTEVFIEIGGKRVRSYPAQTGFVQAVFSESIPEAHSEVKPEHIHHTEYFSYFDEFQDGLLFMHGRNRDHGKRSLYAVSLLIRMPGVPADSRPYLELADLAHQKHVYFAQSDLGKPYVFHCKGELRVKPLARIINRRFGKEPMVSGLVIANHFYGKREEVERLIAREVFDRGEDAPLRQFDECAVLTCGLRGWLSPDENAKEYYLRSIQASWGPEEAFVVAAECFWKELVKDSMVEHESIQWLNMNQQ